MKLCSVPPGGTECKLSSLSTIEWTEATWNPVTGCTKISHGCKHCYAERMAKRLHVIGSERYKNGFNLTVHDDLVTLPLRWRKPKVVFVNSMSDLFHKDVPDDFIALIFRTMEEASWHTFQVLTKRSKRLKQLAPALPWPRNVWMGVSVESEKWVSRIEDLRSVPAAVRFLSLEPLLGPLDNLRLRGIDWVIAGGESGPGARPMTVEWIRRIRAQCRRAHKPFFFKQWGGVHKGKTGRELDGQTWDEMPIAKSRCSER